MIGSIGIAVLVIIITVLFILELRRIWLNKDYQHLPGDKQYPVIGSIYTLKPNKIQDFEIMFSNICCAPIARFYFGGRLIFAISDADAFQQVLSGNMFSERPFLFDFFRLKKGIIMTKCKLKISLRLKTEIQNIILFRSFLETVTKSVESSIHEQSFSFLHSNIC